jgi:hypothetical protein
MVNARVLAAAWILGAVVVLLQATAGEARLAPPREAQRLTSLRTARTGADCCAPQEACCPTPCIKYHHCGPKLCCGCEPPKEVVLKVKNPCTGCEVDVPICMPACCEGEPEVCYGKGLFCRDTVEYEWCCGFRVKVVFRHCGDLLVKTWGY